MAASFFFYDLETSGINPREARIMQFAGQRTDLELQPIGEPVNVLIKLTPDIVPDPDSIMITGITPQSTLIDGLTEAEFLQYFYDEVVQDGTIFLGYNTVRFDDEFMRYLHYRNFYDAYEWQWCNDCSRWDLLDVVRMTRALRPDGIEWPFNDQGKATNRLELITKLNGVAHEQAHDALSDVTATIEVAKLIRSKQPKLFEYLLNCRHKKEVEKLVCEEGKPFIYSCGRYPADTHKTTVAVKVADASSAGGCLVYDLRHDPTEFLSMSAEELHQRWQWTDEESPPKRLPVKALRFNRCPAVAPLQVLDATSQERIGLTLETATKHLAILRSSPTFADTLRQAHALKDAAIKQRFPSDSAVDGQLYEGFIGQGDKQVMRAVRAAKPEHIAEFGDKLRDRRLQQLLPLYKARNFPQRLSADERQLWDNFCRDRLLSGGQQSKLATYFKKLETLAKRTDLTDDQRFALEELRLYSESIMPSAEDGEMAG